MLSIRREGNSACNRQNTLCSLIWVQLDLLLKMKKYIKHFKIHRIGLFCFVFTFIWGFTTIIFILFYWILKELPNSLLIPNWSLSCLFILGYDYQKRNSKYSPLPHLIKVSVETQTFCIHVLWKIKKSQQYILPFQSASNTDLKHC